MCTCFVITICLHYYSIDFYFPINDRCVVCFHFPCAVITNPLIIFLVCSELPGANNVTPTTLRVCVVIFQSWAILGYFFFALEQHQEMHFFSIWGWCIFAAAAAEDLHLCILEGGIFCIRFLLLSWGSSPPPSNILLLRSIFVLHRAQCTVEHQDCFSLVLGTFRWKIQHCDKAS